jgi:DNA-binding CsgD family transcriptional regulator
MYTPATIKWIPLELLVLEYCVKNTELTYKEIGQKLKVSKKSVEGHRDAIFKKLGVHSKAELVKYAIQNGLVSLEVNLENGKKFFSDGEIEL